MSREHSAGLILFRERKGRREYLLMRDRRYWSFPKGHLEPGESETDAAIREVREEVGVTGAKITPGFRGELCYPLPGSGVEKVSVYYAARCPEGQPPAGAAAEVKEIRWVLVEEALPLLGFPRARGMLEDADRFLDDAR